jgi:pimeloyl-ACP methyl ester carboxylesterase
MEEEEVVGGKQATSTAHHKTDGKRTAIILRWTGVGLTLILVVIGILWALPSSKRYIWTTNPTTPSSPPIIPIEAAQEHWVRVNNDPAIRIWFRTWGNRDEGIPVLFVHGGPGNAIADYHNENKKFFSDQDYFVVEVDQRGTGNSQPSVRDSWKNMKYYDNISIDMIVADFEIVREHLGLDAWMVWGGSFGSTLTINYATRYPERCLALILRGIYLDTAEEVHAVYARETYLNNPKRLAEYDTLFDYAQSHSPDETLDANNARQLLEVYETLIQSGRNILGTYYYTLCGPYRT